MATDKRSKKPLAPVQSQWGETPADHFGYASDEERLAKRGMEDWELTERIPESQLRIPYWFIAVVVAVLLISIGLSFPFWGQRPGVHVDWLNWGFIGSLFYIAAAMAFVYFMLTLYGSKLGGRLDSDSNNGDDSDGTVKKDKPALQESTEDAPDKK